MTTMMSSELEILRQRTTELEAENANSRQLEARLAIVEQSSLGVDGQQDDKEAILEVLPEVVVSASDSQVVQLW
ncbi:2163_t:CDS:2 [Rhizophagus irregularis]|nr:2163_t:CDS:2 [Rhizophagus irregularis]